jgi:hypothetical protein
MIQCGTKVFRCQKMPSKPPSSITQSTIAPGTLINTDEYAIYDRLEQYGITHEKAFAIARVSMRWFL